MATLSQWLIAATACSALLLTTQTQAAPESKLQGKPSPVQLDQGFGQDTKKRSSERSDSRDRSNSRGRSSDDNVSVFQSDRNTIRYNEPQDRDSRSSGQSSRNSDSDNRGNRNTRDNENNAARLVRNDNDRNRNHSNHHSHRNNQSSNVTINYYNGGHRAPVLTRDYRRPGHHTHRLPTGVRRLYYQPYPLFYFGGIYYRPFDNGYVVVRAPIGVRVRHLPVGFVTLSVGALTYYYVNDVYYRRDGGDFIVVDAPPVEPDSVPAASTYSTGDWIIYPTRGQSEEQLQRDRYDCHLWAYDQTGFDPTMPNQNQNDRATYYRAQAACLEGRGYSLK